MRWTGLTLAIALMAGCATAPPPNYYTLDLAQSATATATVNVLPLRVDLSERLDRPGIYIQQSPTEATYYANDHWAAPLDTLVREKLEAELPRVAGRASVPIDVEVLRFGQRDTAQGAQAEAELLVRYRNPHAGTSGKVLREASYTSVRTPATPTPGDLTVELSRALEDIAAHVARDAAEVAAQAPRPEPY